MIPPPVDVDDDLAESLVLAFDVLFDERFPPVFFPPLPDVLLLLLPPPP